MSGMMIGILVIAAFLLLMFIGVPIAASMAICGIAGSYFFLHDWTACYTFFSNAVIYTFTSYSTAVVPMFMLMGELASESGIGTNLFSSLQRIMGRMRGGLACAVQMVCAIFGAICGSGSATAAMMCRIAYPEMKKHGYNDRLSCGCIASGSCLATLIPPSAILINYGLAVEESIGKLFVGGIMTGIVLMILFIITVQVWSHFDKNLAPSAEKTTFREKITAIRQGSFLEIIIAFGISMGGMFAGWFTPTEAGAVGVACMLIVTIVFRRFNFGMLFRACKNTLVVSGMMYCMLAGAFVFGKFFTLTKIPVTLGKLVADMQVPALMVILIITIIYLVLGCFIDALPLMLLTAPIFLPIVKTLGYDAVWFGCYVVVIMGLAAVTPPVGISCYLVAWLVERINEVKPTWSIIGFLDDNVATHGLLVGGYPVLGDCNKASDYPNAYFICAIGSARARKAVVTKLELILPNPRFATLIDPSAIVSGRIRIGKGCMICAGNILTVDIQIGDHVIINLGCTLGHDAVLHDFVTIYPNVNVSGITDIGECVELGTGVQIIQGKKIGCETIVGAGAVVVKDLPAKCTAVGSPARPIKLHE